MFIYRDSDDEITTLATVLGCRGPPFKLNLPLGDVDAMWALEHAIIADKAKEELLVSLIQMLMLHYCPVEYFYSGRI